MTPFLAEPSFVRILAWELAILAACFGWGWLVQLGLGLSGRAMGGAYGLCALMAFSGGANATGTFGGAFIVGVIGGGCASAAGFLVRDSLHRERKPSLPTGMGFAWRAACVALLACLFLGQFAFRARTLEFSHVDDYQAYMVFPAKILANGSLGTEPFSERRLVSSLGGKYALDAMVLWGNGFKSLWGSDNAVGLGLLLPALWGTGRRAGLPFAGSAVLCLWGLLMGPPAVNLTAVTLALPLILALQELSSVPAWPSPALAAAEGPAGASGGAWPWRYGLGAGMVLAGLVLLKNSLLPIGGLLVAAHWARRALAAEQAGTAKASAAEIAAVAGGFSVCCLPWMVSAWRDCGTPWFPLLGKGFSATAYPGGYLYSAQAFSPAALSRAALDILRPGPYTPLVLAVLGSFVWAGLARSSPRGRITRISDATLPLAGLAATFVILAQQPSPQGDRFAFAGAMAAVFGACALLAGRVRESGRDGHAEAKRGSGIGRAAYMAIILGLSAGAMAVDIYGNRLNGRAQLYLGMARDPLRAARNLSRLAEGDLVPRSDVQRYAAAQTALPAGAKILDRTLRPFLWDFARNEILIADYPGAASPPPGMPIGRGPRALLDYLRLQGIDFAAYDRRSRAGLHEDIFRPFETDPGTGIWQRSQYRYARLVQRDLEGFDGLCPVAFADAEMVIFSLADSQGK